MSIAALLQILRTLGKLESSILKPLGETNSLFRAAEVAACMQGSTVVDPPPVVGWAGVAGGRSGVPSTPQSARRAAEALFYARTHEPDDD